MRGNAGSLCKAFWMVLLLAAGAGAQAPARQPPQDAPQDAAALDESEPCPGTRQQTAEVKIGEYTVATYRLPNPWGCFTVERKGQQLHSEVGLAFEISGTAERRQWNPQAAPAGTDLSGDGVPNFVVTEWSGGAHCCFLLKVFAAGEEFRQVAELDLEHTGGAEFTDADGDGRWELTAHDWTFAYWNASFARSAAPEIVLRLEQGQFRLAADRMRKPPRSKEETAKLCQQVREDENWNDPEEIPQDLLLPQILLDLIYSGQAREAWSFLHQAWPAGRGGREKYIAQFREQLAKSPYWKEVQALNGGGVWPPEATAPL